MKRLKLSIITVGTAGTLIIAVALPSAAMAQTAAPTAETFNVMVSGSSADGTIGLYNYYPDVVTIDAGDTIVWHEGLGAHSVIVVGPNTKLPPAGSPPALKPAGSDTFDGTGFHNSGILTPGKTYSLTFTKPGIYKYQCGIHPDMTGAVVVQKQGASRPYTPSQAMQLGKAQMQLDLAAGKHAEHQAQPTTSNGPDGTTVYHVLSDLPSPLQWSVPLTSSEGSQIGTANLQMDGKGNLTATLTVLHGAPNTSYTSNIQTGSSAAGAPVAHSLSNVFTTAKGFGTSTTTLSNVNGIPGNIWFIDLYQGKSVAASGQINYPQFGSLRYYPSKLTIHAGDSVIWKTTDHHEAHTVTILAPGQKPQQADKFMTVKKGGNVVSGPGFYNSGFLWYGQTYKLTFEKPGTYHYLCLLHDDQGMLGTIVVLPGSTKTASAATTYTVKSGDMLWKIAAQYNGVDAAQIYQANKQTIGKNADMLVPGEVLNIPGN